MPLVVDHRPILSERPMQARACPVRPYVTRAGASANARQRAESPPEARSAWNAFLGVRGVAIGITVQ